MTEVRNLPETQPSNPQAMEHGGLQNLPKELLDEILNHLDTPDLAYCCRTSKAILPNAQKQLHQRVTIIPSVRNRVSALRRLVKAKPKLMETVQTLIILPHTSLTADRNQQLGRSKSAVRQILPLAPEIARTARSLHFFSLQDGSDNMPYGSESDHNDLYSLIQASCVASSKSLGNDDPDYVIYGHQDIPSGLQTSTAGSWGNSSYPGWLRSLSHCQSNCCC